MRTGYDSVLRLYERDTGATRFIYKTRDWRQTRATQAEMIADGQLEAIEEMFHGPDTACDMFVEDQKRKYRLATPKVRYAIDPKGPRQFQTRIGRALTNTHTGEQYPSMKAACQALGVSYAQVWRFVRGIDRRIGLPLRTT